MPFGANTEGLTPGAQAAGPDLTPPSSHHGVLARRQMPEAQRTASWKVKKSSTPAAGLGTGQVVSAFLCSRVFKVGSPDHRCLVQPEFGGLQRNSV